MSNEELLTAFVAGSVAAAFIFLLWLIGKGGTHLADKLPPPWPTVFRLAPGFLFLAGLIGAWIYLGMKYGF